MDTLRSYKALDLEPGATAEQVRRAYKDLREVWHTDKFIDNPPLRKKAAERMLEIEEAFQTLKKFVPGLDPIMNMRPKAEVRTRPEDAIDDLKQEERTWPKWAISIFVFLLLAATILIALNVYFHGMRSGEPL